MKILRWILFIPIAFVVSFLISKWAHWTMFDSVCFAGPCENTSVTIVLKASAANAVAGAAFGYLAEFVQPSRSKWPTYLAITLFALVMVSGAGANFAQSGSWIIFLVNLVTPIAGIVAAILADKRTLA